MTIGSRVENYTSRTAVVREITQGRGRDESALLKATPGMQIPEEALHKRPKVKSFLRMCTGIYLCCPHVNNVSIYYV